MIYKINEKGQRVRLSILVRSVGGTACRAPTVGKRKLARQTTQLFFTQTKRIRGRLLTAGLLNEGD